MQETGMPEYGITRAVRTCTSRSTLRNVINAVLSKKINAVTGWLSDEQIRPGNCLVVGAYLTGSGIANRLIAQSQVTVLDVYPHLDRLLHPCVSFVTRIDDVIDRDWDFVMDTSGIGGLSLEDVRRIRCTGAFLAEDPVSYGSDEMIRQANRCYDRLKCARAEKRGLLCTGGLRSKTSGTMTLSMDVLRHAMDDAVRMNGVLYSTASMDFSERILFRERDARRFLEVLDRPALTVSALKDTDCDALLWRNISRIRSRVAVFRGGETGEGSSVFQKCGGKSPLGSVVGGRSGWFYRPR